MVVERLAEIMHDLKIVQALGFECGLDEFSWARTMVSSRSFGLDEDFKALLPVVDMLNHEPFANLIWSYADHCVYVRAARDIHPGESLTMNYGYKDNCRLLLNYGFVLPANELMQTVLPVKVAEHPGLASFTGATRILLKFQGVGDQRFKVVIGLARAIVIAAGEDPEQRKSICKERIEGVEIPVVDEPITQEKQAWEWLKDRLSELVDMLGSAEADLQRVSSGGVNGRNVGLYRLGERMALMQAQLAVTEQISMLP